MHLPVAIFETDCHFSPRFSSFQLFLEVGNKHANSFWAANLPLGEEIHSGASEEQRAMFIRRKYRERKYRRVLEGLADPEQFNKVQLF